MGVMDRFLNAMRLNSDDDDDYEDDDFYDEDEEDDEDYYGSRRRNLFRGRRDRDMDYDDEDEDDEFDAPRSYSSSRSILQQSSSKVTPMRAVRRPSGSSGQSSMEVCVIKPVSVDDAREVTETLLDCHTVILNLEGLDLDIAQRIIDFTSGSCYAVSGNLQKISNYIFVVTPQNVDISGDIQNIMSAFGGSSAIQTDI